MDSRMQLWQVINQRQRRGDSICTRFRDPFVWLQSHTCRLLAFAEIYDLNCLYRRFFLFV